MLIDWALAGVGTGVKIWFAAFAVVGLTIALIALLALGMMLFGGRDEDETDPN